MKDRNGIPCKTGNLMAEVTGGGSWDGKSFSSVHLWKVPAIKDGRGITYTVEGEETYFYWARIPNAYKLDLLKLPEGFLFAFKHGLDQVNIEDRYMCLDIHEAISKSDWKETALTPDSVKSLRVISKIKILSFLDVAEKWDSLFCEIMIPHQIVDQIMLLAGYEKEVPMNGEIGIAALGDHYAYMRVYSALKKWKDDGVLIEKCKELDSQLKKLKSASPVTSIDVDISFEPGICLHENQAPTD